MITVCNELGEDVGKFKGNYVWEISHGGVLVIKKWATVTYENYCAFGPKEWSYVES